jgi:23S rRNA pseudouridine1911/1915/1917 synthase
MMMWVFCHDRGGLMHSIDILYEDNHLLVVKKPRGYLSQPANKDMPDLLTELKAYLKVTYHKPGNVFLGLVHRLDANVSGVMVFAKTSKAASRLFSSMREGRFEKSYAAVVKGTLPLHQPKTITDRLQKDSRRKVSLKASSGEGKRATLTYEVLENAMVDNMPVALIDITLDTGRFHQIRKQCALRDMPIAGDRKYGSFFPDEPMALVAYRLAFPHPTKDEMMSFAIEPEGSLFDHFRQLSDL